MSDYTYPIVSWNPVVNQQGETVSSIMFKPDIKALELFNQAPLHTVLVTVSKSGMNIDGQMLFAIIDQSGELPPFGSREKLFNGSGLYTLTLPTTWLGYPIQDYQGEVTLHHQDTSQIITELKSVPPQSSMRSANLYSKKVVAPVSSVSPVEMKSSHSQNQFYEYRYKNEEPFKKIESYKSIESYTQHPHTLLLIVIAILILFLSYRFFFL